VTDLARSLVPAALIAVLAAPLPAWAGKKNDTLIFADTEEVAAFDAYFNNDRIGVITARLTWDYLVYRDPASGEIKPMLAKSFQWINDTTLEFDLREGIKFHNGEAFDADDVVYTINTVLNPATKIKAVSNVAFMKGAEKLGSHKVRILLKAPFPAALEYLSATVPIYPNDYYAAGGNAAMEKQPIGTGPYRVVKVEPGKSVTWEKNSQYFKDSPAPQPQIGKIVYRTIPDKNTQVAELMTGGVDWLWKVEKDQADVLKAMPNLQVQGAPTMRIGYLTMDAAGKGGDSPLKDVRVRRAMNHAINRDTIARTLLGDGAVIIPSACYPSQFGCEQDVPRYPYDPAKAKALLAEAGYPNGFELTFDVYRDPELIQAIAHQFAAVGIKTKLNNAKYATLRDAVRSGQSKLAFLTWGSYSINDVSAATGNFFKFTPDDQYQDAQVRDWLIAGDTSTDPAVRKENYTKALRRIADQAYWVPLWAYPYTYAYTKDLDFTPTPDETPRFAQTRWK